LTYTFTKLQKQEKNILFGKQDFNLNTCPDFALYTWVHGWR